MIKIKDCDSVFIDSTVVYSDNVEIVISKCKNVTIIDCDEEVQDLPDENDHEYPEPSIEEREDYFDDHYNAAENAILADYSDEENIDKESLHEKIIQILDCEYPEGDHEVLDTVASQMIKASSCPTEFDGICNTYFLDPGKYDSPVENNSKGNLATLLSSLIYAADKTLKRDYVMKCVRAVLDIMDEDGRFYNTEKKPVDTKTENGSQLASNSTSPLIDTFKLPSTTINY